jgi:hypothetical protein
MIEDYHSGDIWILAKTLGKKGSIYGCASEIISNGSLLTSSILRPALADSNERIVYTKSRKAKYVIGLCGGQPGKCPL